MTVLTIAWRYLQGRRVASALTVLSIALGVSLVVATTLLTGGIRAGFIEGTTDYGLVVGAKGSPTQLVLNVVFRMDTPTPNISMDTYRDLKDDPLVEVAVPVAMGDAFQGFRYVATTNTYFAAFPWRRRTFTVAAGRLFREDSPAQPAYEAVLGAEAARRTGLQIGDRFYEGEEMAGYPLTVVGVLSPTASADDRAIFFSLPSFWEMNEVSRGMDVKPLTAVLVRSKRIVGSAGTAPAAQRVGRDAGRLSQRRAAERVQRAGARRRGAGGRSWRSWPSSCCSTSSSRCTAPRSSAGARSRPCVRSALAARPSWPSSCWSRLRSPSSGASRASSADTGRRTSGRACSPRGAVPRPIPFAIGALQPVTLAAVVVLGALAGLLPALLAYRTEVAENLAPLS